MAESEEEEGGQRKERHKLLISLKTTVEGLLATGSNNVWSTYGGLNRICHDVDSILNHRMKCIVSDYGSQVDFWPFVKGLKWLDPVLAPVIERIQKSTPSGDGTRGQTWVRESLRDHNLSSQLKVLVGSSEHMHRHYYENAFLSSRPYFKAMCVCLEAVEQNKVALLADIDAGLLNFKRPLDSKVVHNRSASLPITSPKQTSVAKRMHWASEGNAMALAPPFASPKQESILCTSGEHAVPVNFGSSPDDSRTTARNALRNVLRKSGSDTTVGEAPADTFSFYDSINSDPLLNIDFSQNSLDNDGAEDTVPPVSSKLAKRKTVHRSMSENVIAQSRTNKPLEDLDGLWKDNAFTASGGIISRKKTQSAKLAAVFSDSESIEHERKRTSPKKSTKSPKHTHKRSRSDLGGIKVAMNGSPGQDISGSDAIDGATISNSGTAVAAGREGLLPPPTQGQSLINYLSSQDFHTCANLDKENAHFSISEALIAAIEQMKWNHVISPHKSESDQEDGDSDEEIKELKQRIRIRKRERLKEKGRGFPVLSDGRSNTATTSTSQSQSASPFSSANDSMYSDSSESSGVDDQEIELTMTDSTGNTQTNLTKLRNSGLSLSLASLYSDADIQKSPVLLVERQSSIQDSGTSYLSAESVAISLLKKFSEKQLPKASDLKWLVSEQEAPQALLPLPNSYPVSPDDADSRKSSTRTRLRGNLEWAPPRPQIIFNTHPPPRRNVLLAKQNYRCAGCGMKVETGYAKRYRYCDYLGKYFCQCCHSNHLAYIPGRILKKWDFVKYSVSNFSRDLLTKIHNDPHFNILDTNPALYKKVKVLDSVKDWRSQLFHLRLLLQVCKHGASLLNEIQKLPQHWVNDVHLYSVSDLVSVKSGQYGHMYNQLKNLATSAISHVEHCQFCQNFGFICEMCRDQTDIIFPYQLQRVTTCRACKSCYHKKCFVPEKCPKCARIEARKQRLQEDISFDEDKDEIDDG